MISGEEDLDEAGILRRRELMRQRALARAQIGMGQEEVMAKEDEKEASASENEEETTEEETTDSEVGLDTYLLNYFSKISILCYAPYLGT